MSDDTHSNRNLLFEWQEKASQKRITHLDAYYHYSKINTAVGITIIILSALTGSAGLSTFHIDSVPIPIIIGIINICTAILSSVQHFCKFSTKAHTNEKISIEFSNLGRNIETLLARTTITDRDVEHICSEYNTIMNNEVGLPRSLIKQNVVRGERLIHPA